jgi:hypothetical protein
MQSNNTFVIESELSRHRLFLDGRELGTFATVAAAEKDATELAKRVFPGVELRFELDFKWTLSDLEIRAATVEAESEWQVQSQPSLRNERVSICG